MVIWQVDYKILKIFRLSCSYFSGLCMNPVNKLAENPSSKAVCICVFMALAVCLYCWLPHRVSSADRFVFSFTTCGTFTCQVPAKASDRWVHQFSCQS